MDQANVFGIIPARAGFTGPHHPPLPSLGDHPRSRGVYARRRPRLSGLRGSSPLARGLLTESAHLQAPGRIIPARAGFTEERHGRRCPGEDHPRSRGVYPMCGPRMVSRRGSSPLARGLRPVEAAIGGQPRIIPARAGFTPARARDSRSTPDHPRSRGVYHADGRRVEGLDLDHPRSRGVYFTVVVRSGTGLRIIPARAGFTSTTDWRTAASGDHPRSRGVYAARSAAARPRGGSSPLARGLQATEDEDGLGDRIIPARAGFTRGVGQEDGGAGDHPRSRGVYGCAARRCGGGTGSSPLARGLRPG